MAEFMLLASATVGGVLVGALYFGGLWLTVQRLASARRPHLLVLASFAVRLVLAVAVFAVLMRGDLRRGLLALGGFFAVRLVVARRTRRSLVSVGGVDR